MILVPLLLLGFTALVSPAREQGATGMLAGARCGPEARMQLREWSALVDYPILEPTGPTGDRSMRMPTGTLGLWVRLTVQPAGEVSLQRVSEQEVLTLSFGSTCESSIARAGRLPIQGAFSDRDLAARVAQGDPGVILVWSPHMPLSVDQYGVLAAVTTELGISLVVVLDVGADVDYARRVAVERLLPSSAARPIGGVELAFRGLTTHAPSLQVFADGKLKGRVLYGYRGHAAARLAIEEVLQAR
jgi:hypothetical protein